MQYKTKNLLIFVSDVHIRKKSAFNARTDGKSPFLRTADAVIYNRKKNELTDRNVVCRATISKHAGSIIRL